MAKPRLQFTLGALLLTVAAVSLVLALMFHVPPAWGCVALIVLMLAFLALITVAFRYGSEGIRPFCIGAVFPLMFALIHAANDIGYLFDDMAYALRPPMLPGMGMGNSDVRHPTETNFLIGSAILMAIALGYLCVGFRWLIEREPPEPRP